MSAREEHQIQMETKAYEIVNNCPKIVKQFIKSLDSAATKRTYAIYMTYFIQYLSENNFMTGENFYKNISSLDMIDYIDSIKYRIIDGEKVLSSESSRSAKLSCMKSFFNFLVESNLITTNPCANIKPPRISNDKEIIALTKEEADQIRWNIKHGVGSDRAIARQETWRNRDLALFNLACATGLRVTALTEIDIDDIDLDNNTIRVIEKENKVKDIIFGENTWLNLVTWIDDRKYMLCDSPEKALFINSQLKRLSPRSVDRIFQKYSVGIDKHITPHKLRSTYATNLYEQTGDIYLVQNMLGHKSAETTKRYAKLNTEKKIKAAEIADQF